MALINSSEQRLSVSKSYLKPPLMLRDYLRDDLSSCSSNGFKSFPRRQCCSSSSTTTVRFLVQTEIKRSTISSSGQLKRRLTRSRTSCGTAFGFAVQRASTALIHAVKRLPTPFPSSVKPAQSPGVQGRLLSRSFPKRLFGRSFWRKCEDPYLRQNDGGGSGEIGGSKDSDHPRDGDHRVLEIQPPRSFADFLRERLDDQPSDQFSSLSTAAASAAIAVEATDSVAAAAVNVASSSNSSSENGGNSWDESEFFTNSDAVHSSTSGESSASNENDAEEDETETSGERIDAHVGDGSVVNRSLYTENNREERVNEGKDQLSPVSVLDCHFEEEDDDDETSHPSHMIMKETNGKHMKKSRRLRGLTQLEPMDLEKRIKGYIKRQESFKCQNHMLDEASTTDDNTEEDENEEHENRLLDLVKSKIDKPRSLFLLNVVDNLLLDFLQEDTNKKTNAETLTKIVEDWVNGRPQEMYLSWEVKENREVYVREMERREKWGCLEKEREDVIKELEDGFFTTLVEDLMVDMLFC